MILCGGSGSRLWPRSRSKHPKHLLKLDGGSTTLVQETVSRLNLPLERIFCVTEASHADLLKQQLPKIPPQNVVIEPDRRGTSSAVALALLVMKQHLPDDAIVLSLHADSLIREKDKFDETVQAWVDGIRQTERIVSLGIRPTYPSTGFGYINVGQKLADVAGFDVFETIRFVEKPNESTAKNYVDSGSYLWNTGMFGGCLRVLEAEMRQHMPAWMDKLDDAVADLAAGDTDGANRHYLALENDAIDYSLMEKSSKLAVIPASFSWADIGSWADLHDVLEHDADGNLFEGEYVDIDSKDCFVYSPDQLVATIGLSNLVIINTPDAVLICPKDRSQDVKKVVEKLKERGQTKFL